MEKSVLVRLAILLLITSALSGCIWAVEDDGYRGGRGGGGGGHGGGGRGGEHGERH
jgi:hypothetical protein